MPTLIDAGGATPAMQMQLGGSEESGCFSILDFQTCREKNAVMDALDTQGSFNVVKGAPQRLGFN